MPKARYTIEADQQYSIVERQADLTVREVAISAGK
jgi:hypothetical protein